jgi:exosortase/archaeosortase family protein
MKSLVNRFPDLPLALLLLGVTAAVFWPASWWIAQQTFAHEQLRQSFFLLAFAAVILWIDHRKSLRPLVAVSRRAIELLGAAFVLLALALFIHVPYLPLLALALALAAFVHILFGEKGFSVSLPWIAGFGGFLAFVLLFHFADWPLRQLAGSQAGQVLALMGNQVELGRVFHPSGLLLMSVNGRMYEVATECNGFGLVSTSVILALLLTFSRRMAIGWKMVAVVLAFVAGFAFNILRIVGIVTLAPYFPAHYDLIHEVIGLSALFGGLAFLWWLLGGGTEKEPGTKDEGRKPEKPEKPGSIALSS